MDSWFYQKLSSSYTYQWKAQPQSKIIQKLALKIMGYYHTVRIEGIMEVKMSSDQPFQKLWKFNFFDLNEFSTNWLTDDLA